MADDKDKNENTGNSLFDIFDNTEEGKLNPPESFEYEADSEDIMSGVELEIEDASGENNETENNAVEEPETKSSYNPVNIPNITIDGHTPEYNPHPKNNTENNETPSPESSVISEEISTKADVSAEETNTEHKEIISESVQVEENSHPHQSSQAQFDEEESMMIPSVDIAEVDPSYMDGQTVIDENVELSTSDDDIDEIDVIENDPDFSGDESSVNEQVNMNTEDTEDANKNFMSFEEASKISGKKKKNGVLQLNKKRIVYIIFGTIMFLGLFMILKPESWTLTKKQAKNKPEATKTRYTDYESSSKNSFISDEPLDAPRPQFNETGVNPIYTDTSAGSDPAADAYRNAYNQQGSQYVASGSSGYVYEVPDTRNDRLQGKTISGIKGLTSTQENYATDYNLTKEKNSAEAAANTRVTGSSSLRNTDPTEHINQMLSSINSNSYVSQNDQSGKQGFYNNGRGNGGGGLWLGLNTIWQGTIFNVILTSEINTDLPGEVTGRVSKNIYSSQDGRYLLIPQNSVLIGNYNSSISYAQSRAQVIWHTLIRPDGYQINLGAMNGTDTKGAAGLKGFVNDHPMAYLKAIALMSTFSIINGEFQATQAETNNQYVQNIAANSQEMVNKLGEKLIDRAMDVQPTIIIKAGTQVNVVVNQNLTLPEYKKPEVTQKYMRGKLPRELY